MISKALARYIRISSKRMQPITRIVRGKRVGEALFTLGSMNKRGARVLKTIIESALANAKRVPDKTYTDDELYISRLTVDQGPSLKRFRAMSMGRAGTIRKRTSHVRVELDLLPGVKPAKKEQKEKVSKKKLVKQGA